MAEGGFRSRLRPALRQFNRLRWWQKGEIVTSHGASRRRHLRYVLLDFPFEAYCYGVANVDELARDLADAFSRRQEEVRMLFDELLEDDQLQVTLARRLRLPADRRRVEFGYRLPWYVITRLSKPRLIVETGVQSGLGSALLLRALDRNADEGSPGELVSVDTAPKAGWLAEDRAASPWRRLTGPSHPTLSERLADRRVGMLVHDSPHTEEVQRAEFGFALEHADDQLILVDASGVETPLLPELCQWLGVTYHLFREVPAGGFYEGVGCGCVIVPGVVARERGGLQRSA